MCALNTFVMSLVDVTSAHFEHFCNDISKLCTHSLVEITSVHFKHFCSDISKGY